MKITLKNLNKMIVSIYVKLNEWNYTYSLTQVLLLLVIMIVADLNPIWVTIWLVIKKLLDGFLIRLLHPILLQVIGKKTLLTKISHKIFSLAFVTIALRNLIKKLKDRRVLLVSVLFLISYEILKRIVRESRLSWKLSGSILINRNSIGDRNRLAYQFEKLLYQRLFSFLGSPIVHYKVSDSIGICIPDFLFPAGFNYLVIDAKYTSSKFSNRMAVQEMILRDYLKRLSKKWNLIICLTWNAEGTKDLNRELYDKNFKYLTINVDQMYVIHILQFFLTLYSVAFLLLGYATVRRLYTTL